MPTVLAYGDGLPDDDALSVLTQARPQVLDTLEAAERRPASPVT